MRISIIQLAQKCKQLLLTLKTGMLVILGPDRLAAAPEIPSMADVGFRDFDGTGWAGISAPAATPRPIIDKFSAELQRIARLPHIRDQFETPGLVLVGNSAAEFDHWLAEQTKRWSALIRERGFKVE